jgi:hypothetical protein
VEFHGVVLSTAAISISINSPPLPGKFQVTPAHGTELDSVFTYCSLQWFDDELPLTYEFGYISFTGTPTVLQSRSLVSYSKSVLPAGLDSAGHIVSLFSQIFDVLDSNSSANARVTVTEAAQILSISGVAQFIQGQVNSSRSVDDVKKLNAFSSYLLNRVNCSAAPDCHALGRQDCGAAANTCGECLPGLLSGVGGDSNDPCYASANATTDRGWPCSSSSDCAYPLVCSSSQCAFPIKTCAGNCSDHGQCIHVNINSGLPLTAGSCRLDNAFCAAKCQCDEDFRGSERCDLGLADLAMKRELRAGVVANVALLGATEFPDSQAVSGWINALTDASRSSNELSDVSMSSILNTSRLILSAAASALLPNTVLSGLLPTLNSAAAYAGKQQQRSRRRLSTNSSGNHEAIQSIVSTLQSFSSSIASTMLPGQESFTAAMEQFQLSVASYSPTHNSATLSTSLPATSSERPPSSIVVPMASQATSVSVVSVLSSQYGIEDGLQSNPLSIQFSTSPCAAASLSCTVQVVLQHSQAITLVESAASNDTVDKVCRMGAPQNSSFVCSSGHRMDTSCNGSFAGAVRWACPSIQHVSSCAVLQDGTLLSPQLVCKLVNYTSINTTCSCDMLLPDRHFPHRRLLRNSVTVSNLVDSVASSSKATILSASHLSASDVQKEWTVLATLVTLVVIIGTLMAIGHHLDAQSKKTVDSSKQLDKKSVDQVKSHGWAGRRRLPNHIAIADRKKREESALLEESLPQVLRSQSFPQKIVREVKEHHRWLGVFCSFSPSFPRLLRVLSLADTILVMLFMQSVTYNLTKPDDGSCATFQTKDSCLAQPSAFNADSSKCAWADESSACSFVEPSQKFSVVLFVAIFSSLVSTPIAYFQNWIIHRFLAAPTKSPHGDETGSQPPRDSLQGPRQLTEDSAEFDAVDGTMSQLLDEMQLHRQSLSSAEREEFDSKT